MFRLLVTLCIFVVISVNSTLISVDQRFTCTSQNDWQFEVLYYEADYFGRKDDLHKVNQINVKGRSAIINVKTEFECNGGDGDVFDYYYEIFMIIYHNCSIHGERVKSTIELGQVAIRRDHASFKNFIVLNLQGLQPV